MQVIRGTFTRRLFFLFLFLSLIPTLIIMIIPPLQRIQAENEYHRQFEWELQQKAKSSFANSISAKASSFAESLQHRTNNLIRVRASVETNLLDFSRYAATSQWKIADRTIQLNNGLLNSLSDEDVIFTASFPNDPGNIDYLQMQAALAALPEIRWIVQHDPTIRSVFISTALSTVVIPSTLNKDMGYINPFHEIDFKHVPDDHASMWITNIDNDPILSILSPIHYNDTIWGYIGLEILLNRYVQEISTYGLSENMSLFLISDDMEMLATPSWRKNTEILKKIKINPDSLIGLNILNEMPEKISTTFIQNEYPGRLQLDIPYDFKVYYNESIAYFGTARISTSPLNLMLVFPIEDLYDQANSYGASASINTVPIITQAIISVVGFVLVVSAGGYFTLRKIAYPVKELLKGANSIANGKLDYRVPDLEEGEMQELAFSFNKMGDVIQKTQVDLQNKQIELMKNLEEQQREQLLINNITSLSNTLIDLPNKIKNLLNIIIESLGTEYCSIHFIADVDRSISSYERSRIPDHMETYVSDFQQVSADLVQQAVKEKKVIACTQFFNDPQMPRNHKAYAVPIILHSHTIGVMTLLYPDSCAISTTNEAFLTILSTHIALLFENSHLQEQAHTSAINEERRRMARELHDSVSQSAFSLSLTAKSLQSTELSENAKDRLDFLISQTDAIRSELRTIINELRPIDLINEGLEDAIRGHIASLEKNSGIRVNTCINTDLDRLSVNIKHNVNRIIQEALNNIAHHANASEVNLCIQNDSDRMSIQIDDNGQGFDRNTVDQNGMNSFGIISMRERAEAMNGALYVDSAPGKGTRIKVVIPYEEMERGKND